MKEDGLFFEFFPSTKEEWLAKVAGDLGVRPLSELHWQSPIGEVSPFFHQGDLEGITPGMSIDKTSNSWSIGEFILECDIGDMNRHILTALDMGAGAICVAFRDTDTGALPKVFAGVEHQLIETHLRLDTSYDALGYLNGFISLLQHQGQDLSVVEGSIRLSPRMDEMYWIVVKRCLAMLPCFRICIDDLKDSVESGQLLSGLLAETMYSIYILLQNGQAESIAIQELASRIQVEIALDDTYYMSIIRLRAIRNLWKHLLSSYPHAVDDSVPLFVGTWLSPSSQTVDENHNLIKSSTQLLAATIGSADLIYASTPSGSETQNHHVRRNIQHLLYFESHMNRTVDPSAGSYFFEYMTDHLCEQAWTSFCNKVERR